MKAAIFLLGVALSGAAVAQTTDQTTDMSQSTGMTQPTGSDMSTTGYAATMAPASGAVVQPGNASPRRDARGIPVISAAATVPGGWNGTTSTGMGGPMVDPATGAAINDVASAPPCTRTVTDHCLQTYERHRRR